MPAASKQQQKFMGLVHALQKGDIKPSDVSQDVRDAAKSMKKKDAKDFASTSHKGLPKKVKQEILNRLKEYANKMGTDHLGGDDYTSSKKGGLRDFDGYDNVDYNPNMKIDEGPVPQNWMQGRVSDYHTKKGTTPREDYDDTNFDKENSGQPDLEESFGSDLDMIKKDSKNLKDFIKKVLSDNDFRSLKGDRDFVKYLSSMYNESVLSEGPIHSMMAMKAAQKAMEKQKVRNPKTGNDVSAYSAFKDKNHPSHKQALSLFQRIKKRLVGEYASNQTLSYIPADAEEVEKMNEAKSLSDKEKEYLKRLAKQDADEKRFGQMAKKGKPYVVNYYTRRDVILKRKHSEFWCKTEKEADRFLKSVEKAGGRGWIRKYSSPDDWKKRSWNSTKTSGDTMGGRVSPMMFLASVNNDEKINETMIRRAMDLAQELLPKDTWSRYASDGKKNAEFVKSIVRDLAQLLNKFYKDHKVDVRLKEEVLSEVLAGRINHYTGSNPGRLVPGSFATVKNDKDREKKRAIEQDLAYHLNSFWKKWNFPYRIDLTKKEVKESYEDYDFVYLGKKEVEPTIKSVFGDSIKDVKDGRQGTTELVFKDRESLKKFANDKYFEKISKILTKKYKKDIVVYSLQIRSKDTEYLQIGYDK